MRLNLFAVRDDTGQIVDDGYDSKERAKERRDELERFSGAEYFVTYGRDHRKYRGPVTGPATPRRRTQHVW